MIDFPIYSAVLGRKKRFCCPLFLSTSFKFSFSLPFRMDVDFGFSHSDTPSDLNDTSKILQSDFPWKLPSPHGVKKRRLGSHPQLPPSSSSSSPYHYHLQQHLPSPPTPSPSPSTNPLNPLISSSTSLDLLMIGYASHLFRQDSQALTLDSPEHLLVWSDPEDTRPRLERELKPIQLLLTLNISMDPPITEFHASSDLLIDR